MTPELIEINSRIRKRDIKTRFVFEFLRELAVFNLEFLWVDLEMKLIIDFSNSSEKTTEGK